MFFFNLYHSFSFWNFVSFQCIYASVYNIKFFYIICIVYYSFIVFLFLFFHLFPSSMFLAFKSPVNMYHFGVFLYCSSLQSLVVRFVPSVCMGAGIFILIFIDFSANFMFFDNSITLFYFQKLFPGLVFLLNR